MNYLFALRERIREGLKYLIRNLDLNEAKELAAEALKLESSAEILERSTAMARRIAPDLFKNQTEPGT